MVARVTAKLLFSAWYILCSGCGCGAVRLRVNADPIDDESSARNPFLDSEDIKEIMYENRKFHFSSLVLPALAPSLEPASSKERYFAEVERALRGAGGEEGIVWLIGDSMIDNWRYCLSDAAQTFKGSIKRLRDRGSDSTDLLRRSENLVRPVGTYETLYGDQLVPADVTWWINNALHDVNDDPQPALGVAQDAAARVPRSAFNLAVDGSTLKEWVDNDDDSVAVRRASFFQERFRPRLGDRLVMSIGNNDLLKVVAKSNPGAALKFAAEKFSPDFRAIAYGHFEDYFLQLWHQLGLTRFLCESVQMAMRNENAPVQIMLLLPPPAFQHVHPLDETPLPAMLERAMISSLRQVARDDDCLASDAPGGAALRFPAGVKIIDHPLTSLKENGEDIEPYFYIDDLHPNRDGSERVANMIVGELRTGAPADRTFKDMLRRALQAELLVAGTLSALFE